MQESLGQAVLIQGEAGIGKSRLVQVLKEQGVGGEQLLAWECRCSPYHRHTALYPLIDLLQRTLQAPFEASPAARLERLEALLAQDDVAFDESVALLAGLLSLPLPAGRYAPWSLTSEGQRERTLEALVSLFLAQTSASPVLMIVEDVHWADALTLACLRRLMDHIAAVALLLVVTCRPGFELPRGQQSEMTPVVLKHLTRAQTEAMITQVATGKRLPAAMTEQLVEKTGGVPLFVEELTRMVVESGQLVERETPYELRSEVVQLTIPMSLHHSLLARLDHLGRAKDIAQWGSVLGREFSYGVLEAVTPYDEVVLREGLGQLQEAGLLFRRGLFPQAQFRFKHALVQDAAYDSLLTRRRQAMRQHRREIALAHQYTEAGLTLAREHALTYWMILGHIRCGSLLAAQGQTTEGCHELRQGLASYRARGAQVSLPIFLAQLAEVYGQQGQTDEGLQLLAEAHRVMHQGGDRSWEAEQYRLQGAMLLLQYGDRPTGAGGAAPPYSRRRMRACGGRWRWPGSSTPSPGNCVPP